MQQGVLFYEMPCDFLGFVKRAFCPNTLGILGRGFYNGQGELTLTLKEILFKILGFEGYFE